MKGGDYEDAKQSADHGLAGLDFGRCAVSEAVACWPGALNRWDGSMPFDEDEEETESML